MKRHELDRAFPETPPVFSARIDQTLRQIKEEEPVKKITFRAVLVAAMVTLLIGGIAFAAISLGQEWYYNNRFTAYKEHKPEKHQAIMDNLVTNIAQENAGEAAKLVDLKVQDASWSKEQRVLTISYAASALFPDKDEMYAYWELDQDGVYTVEIDPDDPDSRTEHWLFASHAHGIPRDVMKDPNKRLLLIDPMRDVYIGNSGVTMPMWASDILTNPEGIVFTLHEFDLKQLEDAEIAKNYENRGTPQGWTEADYEKYLKDEKARLLAKAKDMREAIANNTDAEGYLPLRMPYELWFFDLEKNEVGDKIDGELSFKVKVPQ